MKATLYSSFSASILVAFGLLLSQSASQNAFAQVQNDERGLRVQLSEPVKQWPSSVKRWALIVGVDQYRDRQISPLNGASNDAKLLAEALIQRAGFPSDQVILLATDQPEERQPTRVNILRRLSNLAAVVPKDGLLFFTFAGHGMERGGQAFLLPSDAQISDDVGFLEETSLSVARIKDRIKATSVQQVVLLLDACRNDPIGRADAPNKLTETYTRGFNFDIRNKEVTAFATLYATAVGERAYEYTEKRQGYFTWAIVEGLKGGAANDRGEVTLYGLLRYIQDTVPKRIAIEMGAGKAQHPFAVIEGYKADELVIAVAGPVAVTVENNPSSKPDSAAIELSFWDSIKNSADPADFKAYLQEYPNGRFVTLAKNRLAHLEASSSKAARGSSEPSLNLSGLFVRIFYRDKSGINRLGDANRIAAKLKEFGAVTEVKKNNYKDYKDKLYYHDDKERIALTIAERIKDIALVSIERVPGGKAAPSGKAGDKTNEFYLWLQ